VLVDSYVSPIAVRLYPTMYLPNNYYYSLLGKVSLQTTPSNSIRVQCTPSHFEGCAARVVGTVLELSFVLRKTSLQRHKGVEEA